MLDIGESGYFDTISMGLFFFFHCIVLQISMRFEMTFLIKNKMEKKQACKFCPPLLHGFKNGPVISEFTFNHPFPFFAWGGGEEIVLNLRCTTCFVTIIKLTVYKCVGAFKFKKI